MATFIEKSIDTWLLSFFALKMGSGSDYADLKLEDIRIASLRTQSDWVDWQLPALGCARRYARRRIAGHGPAKPKLYRVNPYALTFVVKGDTQDEASDLLLELLARAESTLRSITPADIGGAITTDNGGRFIKLLYYESTDPDATVDERQAGFTRTRFYRDPADNRIFGAGDYNIVFLTTTGE